MAISTSKNMGMVLGRLLDGLVDVPGSSSMDPEGTWPLSYSVNTRTLSLLPIARISHWSRNAHKLHRTDIVRAGLHGSIVCH